MATAMTQDQLEILKEELAEIGLHILDETEFAALSLGPDDYRALFGAPDGSERRHRAVRRRRRVRGPSPRDDA